MEFAVKVTGTFDDVSNTLNYQRLFDFWNYDYDIKGYNNIWLGQEGTGSDIAFEIFNYKEEVPLPRVVLTDAIQEGVSQTWIAGFHITTEVSETAASGKIFLFEDANNDGEYTDGEASVVGNFEFDYVPGPREFEYVGQSPFTTDSKLDGVVSELETLNPDDINLVGLFSQDGLNIDAV